MDGLWAVQAGFWWPPTTCKRCGSRKEHENGQWAQEKGWLKGNKMTLQDHKDSFAKYLRAALGRRGLTGVELAKVADLPEDYIRRLLRAHVSPSHVVREKIARALGIDVMVMEGWYAREETQI